MPEIPARLVGVTTSTPPRSYRQQEVLDRFEVSDRRIRALFRSSHIEQRHLYLPQGDGRPEESQAQLLDKHRDGTVELASRAVGELIGQLGMDVTDVDYLCCVTSTGWLVPGVSAHLMRAIGFRPDCGRLDVVGMGCNAGLNGLAPVAAWARANPGRLALMVCVEVCSASYVFDETMRAAVANSLFGDGCAVAAVSTDGFGLPVAPMLLDFDSHIATEALEAMRFDWDETHGKYSFYLDPDIPYVVGANAARPVDRLLGRHGLRRRDVDHWVVHTGGKKVIDALKINLGLTDANLRHTRSVLRDFGNVSSASFLFSYKRLLAEGACGPGDVGVLMTMGPGSTIETALVRW